MEARASFRPSETGGQRRPRRHGHGNNPIGLKGIVRTIPSSQDLIYDQTDDNEMPSAVATQVASCGADYYGISLLADKEKGRCERYLGTGIASDSDKKVNECMCKALLSDPAIKSGRHAYTWVPKGDPYPTHKTQNGKGISAFASSAGRYSRYSGKDLWFFLDCEGISNCGNLGHCFVDRTTPSPRKRLDIGIAFDHDGTAILADVLDEESFLSADEKTCVIKKLMTARIPCPADPFAVKFTRRSWMDVEIKPSK